LTITFGKEEIELYLKEAVMAKLIDRSLTVTDVVVDVIQATEGYGTAEHTVYKPVAKVYIKC